MAIADLIRLVLTHVPLICFVAALPLAWRGQGPVAGCFLSWLLLAAGRAAARPSMAG